MTTTGQVLWKKAKTIIRGGNQLLLMGALYR